MGPATLAPLPSRIFVKNLPPNIREEDFKKHFAQLAQPTDTKLIAKRRIGYVGYRSAEEASKAVKYYNRSFIRMSKIAVEFAKSIDESHRQPKQKQPDILQHGPPQPSTADGRADDIAPRAVDGKIEEFLEAMAPSSKGRTWDNEDKTVQKSTAAGAKSEPAVEDDGFENDEDYQVISKKRKRDSSADSGEVPAPAKKSLRMSTQVETPTMAANSRDKDMEDKKVSAEPVAEVMDDSAVEVLQEENTDTQPSGHVSDSDWLRSRTSRLLGLLDDDEFDDGQDVQATSRDNSKIESLKPVNRRQSTSSHGSDVPNTSTQGVRQAPLDQTMHPPDSLPPKDDQPVNTTPLEEPGTGRIFIRNLPYSSTEAELSTHFSGSGKIEEVHISRDTRSGGSKGFGYVQFKDTEAAALAIEELDGKPFQGRLLHVIPATKKKQHGLDEYAMSKLPLKKQQQIRRKAEASRTTFKWNSMYMNPDAVVSSIADRLGVDKTEILDPTSTDAAVKQAHAEASVIGETKSYFASQGVNLDSFKEKGFNDRVILVKNFTYGTTAEEIRKTFEPFGTVTRMLMPPAATIAIVEMEQPTQARSAFGSLSYRKFKDTVLFLEKAPKNIFEGKAGSVEKQQPQAKESKMSTSELLEEPSVSDSVLTSTLFIRNLNFSTTSAELRDLFKPLQGFLSARVKTKTNPKQPEQPLSMGFGFVEFKTKEDARSALAAMNGYQLAGHDLVIRESHKALDAAEERRREDVAKKMAGRRTKIIIKNLPFEASKQNVRDLFKRYGQLRSVRVPKKFDSSSRGFAFADFVTTREAENAMKALQGGHLLGRRLNLDFASEETVDPEEEIKNMQKKVEKQADRVAIQKLTGGGRKKFALQQDGYAEID